MHSGPTMSGACAMLPCDNCATMSVMGVFFSAPMIHQFEVYVDDTPHISAMSSNVITFECLRRLREFRQSLKLAAAGVRMYLLLAHLGRENCKLHLGLGSKEEICALVSDMRFCHPHLF